MEPDLLPELCIGVLPQQPHTVTQCHCIAAMLCLFVAVVSCKAEQQTSIEDSRRACCASSDPALFNQTIQVLVHYCVQICSQEALSTVCQPINRNTMQQTSRLQYSQTSCRSTSRMACACTSPSMVSSLAGKLCHHLLYAVHAQSHRGAAGLPEAPPASGVSAPLSACGGHRFYCFNLSTKVC